MKLPSWPVMSTLRYGCVLLTLSVVTICYYSFSHYVHNIHFHIPPHNDTDTSTGSHGEDHHHGRKGSFENMFMKKDHLFLTGLALPLLLLTLVSVVWNPSTSANVRVVSSKNPSDEDCHCNDNYRMLDSNSSVTTTTATATRKTIPSVKRQGDINVGKWTIVWFLLPLLFVMLDGARSHISRFHGSSGSSQTHSQSQSPGWSLYLTVCMSLMSPSGYAATWALALFLIPVTKHSPILDWLRVTPVQALAFHRVAGWTSFWNSVLHGFLHLRHLMDVLNPQRTRSWHEQLKILLVPNSMKCFKTQNPWDVFWNQADPLASSEGEAQQCWLSLVNATGMISVLAFLVLAVTSLPQVRRYSYKVFYSVHIPAAWIMLVTAIWHYPACVLVLIPNIIYYISFHIPVYVGQRMDSHKLQQCEEQMVEEECTNSSNNNSSLLEASFIEGGALELTFAAASEDQSRHESRFVRLSCPYVCQLSHPFSIFSKQDLLHIGDDYDESISSITLLLRSSGPFTTNLTRLLFPEEYEQQEEGSKRVVGSVKLQDRPTLVDAMKELPLSTIPRQCISMKVDSYYGGSFDWVNKATLCHDQLLLVAGGVGIVPFLEFLPSLQKRILANMQALAKHEDSLCQTGTTDLSSSSSSSLVQAMLDTNTASHHGPTLIHLHWYCREVGLACYVWKNYLRPHAMQAWEGNSSCRGRLKIHIHVTSLNANEQEVVSALETFEGTSSTSGLLQKKKFNHCSSVVRPVHDASFTQSKFLALLLPGLIMLVGTISHWWWYKNFVINDKWLHDNLVIRSHSIIFTLVFAIVCSFAVEHYRRLKSVHRMDDKYDRLEDLRLQDTTNVTTSESVDEKTFTNGSLSMLSPVHKDVVEANDDSVCFSISAGRPSTENVIGDIVESNYLGVYSCGPRSLMETVEGAVKDSGVQCAFYREDSEL